MLRKLQRAARGSANAAAKMAVDAVDPDKDDPENDQEDDQPDDQSEEDASADETEEDAADDAPQEEDEEAPEDDENTPKASAINAETKRVLAIVGSKAGLANPKLAIELAGVDEDGHRMSVKRATSILQSAGSKKSGTLASKMAGQSGGLSPDGGTATGIEGNSFNAQMLRKNAALNQPR